MHINDYSSTPTCATDSGDYPENGRKYMDSNRTHKQKDGTFTPTP